MIEFIIATLFASSAAMADVPANEIPTNVDELETAEFQKKIYYAQRHEMAAERIAKKANCEFPVSARWVNARIDAAILVAPDGELVKIVPVNSGCRELEDYTMAHLAKYAGKAGPITSGSEAKWYRTAMHFHWPE